MTSILMTLLVNLCIIGLNHSICMTKPIFHSKVIQFHPVWLIQYWENRYWSLKVYQSIEWLQYNERALTPIVKLFAKLKVSSTIARPCSGGAILVRLVQVQILGKGIIVLIGTLAKAQTFIKLQRFISLWNFKTLLKFQKI